MGRDVLFTYYFMYGTQVLNFQKFDRQFATVRPEGQATLSDWKMLFNGPHGQPNLIPSSGSRVSGLIWLIESAELPKLDQAEGGQRHEGKLKWLGNEVDGVFYTFAAGQDKPNTDFLNELRHAYKVALLPQKQIDDALGIQTPAAVRGDSSDIPRPVK